MHTESFIILITDLFYSENYFSLSIAIFFYHLAGFFSLSLFIIAWSIQTIYKCFFFVPMPLSIGMSILVRIIDYIFDRSIRVTLLELLESEERMIDFFWRCEWKGRKLEGILKSERKRKEREEEEKKMAKEIDRGRLATSHSSIGSNETSFCRSLAPSFSSIINAKH